jgi:hypothetical protein
MAPGLLVMARPFPSISIPIDPDQTAKIKATQNAIRPGTGADPPQRKERGHRHRLATTQAILSCCNHVTIV